MSGGWAGGGGGGREEGGDRGPASVVSPGYALRRESRFPPVCRVVVAGEGGGRGGRGQRRAFSGLTGRSAFRCGNPGAVSRMMPSDGLSVVSPRAVDVRSSNTFFTQGCGSISRILVPRCRLIGGRTCLCSECVAKRVKIAFEISDRPRFFVY